MLSKDYSLETKGRLYLPLLPIQVYKGLSKLLLEFEKQFSKNAVLFAPQLDDLAQLKVSVLLYGLFYLCSVVFCF